MFVQNFINLCAAVHELSRAQRVDDKMNQDHQALLKAKYSPRVAAASCTQVSSVNWYSAYEKKISNALSTFCRQYLVVKMHVFSWRLKVLRLSSGSRRLSRSEFQVHGPATAKRRRPKPFSDSILAIVILSVRLSVCLSRPGTNSGPGETETLGSQRMIA